LHFNPAVLHLGGRIKKSDRLAERDLQVTSGNGRFVGPASFAEDNCSSFVASETSTLVPLSFSSQTRVGSKKKFFVRFRDPISRKKLSGGMRSREQ
jgi:hypothetical protein